MAGNPSIESLLDRLRRSILDIDELSIFLGSLKTHRGGDCLALPLDQLKRKLSIENSPAETPISAGLNNDRRHESSNNGELGFAEVLQRHLCNAYAIHQRLSQLEAEVLTLHGFLNRLARGVALLDARGRCVFANSQVQCLLAKHDGMQLVQGRLCACMATDQFQLRKLIGLVVSGSTSLDMRLLLHSADGCPALILTLTSLLDPLADGRQSSARAIVFTHPVVPHSHKADAILKELFGFTIAETSLALALFDTGDLAKACEHLGKSLATGRVQLRQVMDKTGCHRQNGLFRVLAAALSLPDAGLPLSCPYNPFE